MADQLDELPEDDQSSGGIVMVASQYNDDLGKLSELFGTDDKLREAARFAFAVGIRTGQRIKRGEWPKGKGEHRRIAHLSGQFDNNKTYDFAALLEILKLSDKTVKLNILVSEYITGGMKWIAENDLMSGKNFDKLRERFPDMFDKLAEPSPSQGPAATES